MFSRDIENQENGRMLDNRNGKESWERKEKETKS